MTSSKFTINSLSALLSPLERTPSPIARDDIIEGMSASTASIFERDVQHFHSTLTAQEAIQLAVPPVLDQAIQALATLSTENILIDQIPLDYHLFTNSIDQQQQQPQSSSTPTQSISAYPFPSVYPHPPLSPASLPPLSPRLHHQTISCTSDTASTSDPSSPRSLSPTPSYRLGRSMVTQLSDQDSMPTHHHIPTEILGTTKNKQQPIIIQDRHGSSPARKTRISFMSYVDILNSERSDPLSSSLSITEPGKHPTTAMNTSKMAKKSTSSLIKRASSSIFSQPSRSKPSNQQNEVTRTECLGTAWVDRSSRSTSTSNNTPSTTTYHSCSTINTTTTNTTNDQHTEFLDLELDFGPELTL
ncbi:hypothetical protein MJO28_014147 [Puccinia striiformis f. sp. tritici]|uniref:Uncharacterized protein n=1 Tax=Puccinia striiformis f. sp. tritici TaxID=168172 RepID=A0ACC0DSS2_9BASI|nr:hypothetical protein Pst134EA_026612 [Puccinia striiformis f. sp. tritici]KAH9449899.1 hypothetical protein Pst134EA_026612 [Puccinia striiformis f. sp. tritici]KAI7938568.1 hypothetical protein MJO28_014147 [Puccinia striiformis f. sp. tritici]KAI7939271.1 hypothetical protein MJO29_014007 [Puccinia striiformis f. sp. tritici]